MSLVAYPDSSEDESSAKKLKPDLPMLPTTFLDLYSSTVRSSTQDDPTLHGGRKRAVPHVEGNWPTHVFLEWHPDDQEQKLLTTILDLTHGNGTHSLLRNELGVTLPLHVSLSRPLVLKTEQKDDFLLSIRTALQTARLDPFTRRPVRLRWHLNEDGSRDFLVLQLDVPESHDPLDAALQACNRVAAQYNQPLLYTIDHDDLAQHSQFHISIAWALPMDSQSTSARVVELPQQLQTEMQALRFAFQEVKVRIGQEVTSLPFSRRSTATRSLFS